MVYSISVLFLQEYEVDLALWSYHHSYQRTCPVYRGNCVPPGSKGTIHLVVGTGGAQLERNITWYVVLV